MKISIEEFWKWFEQHNEHLMDIDSLEEQQIDDLLHEFDSVLKSYCEGISFEIGDLTKNGRTLTFTADGNEEFFDDVVQLCDNMPILDFWEVIALKPPQGENVSIVYEKYKLKSKDLWFVPMESEEQDDKIGIKVGIKDYNEDDEDQLVAVYSLIEAMIGEYDCTMLLAYFELCSLPQEPDKEDFIPLTELPQFVFWHFNK
jgi:hypothetical protein